MTAEPNAIRAKARQLRESLLTAEAKPPRSVIRRENLPPDLIEQTRWIVWKWYRKDGRWTKRPYQTEGLPASISQPKHWASFEDAFAAFSRSYEWDGIGAVLGAGFVGVDLDCCVEDGRIDAEAMRILRHLDTYSEISPTLTGVKAICRGSRPADWSDTDAIEIKDKGYFCLTGDSVEGMPDEIRPFRPIDRDAPPQSDKRQWALASMRKVPVNDDERDGSARLVRYARQAVRCGLETSESIETIREMLDERPTKRLWTDDEIYDRLRDADRKRGQEVRTQRLTLPNLIRSYPERRPELVHGLLRRGEVMNIIGAPKQGKSWLVYGLALAVASGTPWLGHETERGKVVLIDNELHPSELAYRLGIAIDAMVLPAAELEDRFVVEPMRGSRPDLAAIDELLQRHYLEEDVSLIVLDAYYRLLPPGVSENDNAAVTQIFNRLDQIANRHNCSIALVHHASKGDQSNKDVTDVGAGAGALTRATDTHLIVRPHEQESMAVIEAVCRSHKQPDPSTIVFDFPLWRREEAVEPRVRVPKSEADRRQTNRDGESCQIILDFLRDNGKSTEYDIRKATGFGTEKALRVLGLLVRKGDVSTFSGTSKKGRETQFWEVSE